MPCAETRTVGSEERGTAIDAERMLLASRGGRGECEVMVVHNGDRPHRDMGGEIAHAQRAENEEASPDLNAYRILIREVALSSLHQTELITDGKRWIRSTEHGDRK